MYRQAAPAAPPPIHPIHLTNLKTTCDQIFATTKELVPLGAENQISDLVRTGGNSGHRVVLGQSSANPERLTSLTDRVGAWAAAAVGTKAGNCDDQAAVAFDLANQAIYKGVRAGTIHPSVQIAYATTPGHRYTIIGIPNMPIHQYAVDTWQVSSRVLAVTEFNIPHRQLEWRQVQTVEAFVSTSSAKISEGFFQLWILRGRSLISEATIAKY
ncbi:hypothetical protein, partial [Micromonospora sp. NPDC050695]|uniref:hypothetical protein n=1 Tax=Micromonospora sp. NPDC050695 TaxID=3154938 RepID=UPI0033D083F4